MFFKHINFIAVAITSTLLYACGGDGKASGSEMKFTGANQAKVFKTDNSVQCEEEGVSLDEMRLELAKAGIDVICAQKANNGLNYPQFAVGAMGILTSMSFIAATFLMLKNWDLNQYKNYQNIKIRSALINLSYQICISNNKDAHERLINTLLLTPNK